MSDKAPRIRPHEIQLQRPSTADVYRPLTADAARKVGQLSFLGLPHPPRFEYDDPQDLAENQDF